jgi:curved DNA-binding protein CbpA
VTHYDVLGVRPDASTAQIRAAFRRLARAHHPDTSPSGSAESLAPINEAWRVLGDPVSRHAYDRSLRAAASSAAPEQPADPVLVAPAESTFPWRFLMGLAVVGIVFALVGVFTYKPSKPGPPDNVLTVGSCVVVQDNGDAIEVNCESQHDGVVRSLLGEGQHCPADEEPHRDRQGLGEFCINFDT